ncbi:MAG: hypothetical protein HOW73_46910 [Polyangiaceae bacterium]|nr:hypothetical protein [Polyangiaceae bacterium]
MFVSFLSEEGPGNGPAMLRMVNDTDGQILSLTMPTGEAFSFYLVEPLMATDYVLASSDNMLEDAILSLHTLDTCVRRPFSAMNGPLSLDPGKAYSIHVALEDGFIATIEEEAAPDPFVGLRVIINDPSKPSEVGAASMLYVSSAGGELVFEDVYDELPAPFAKMEMASLELESLRFVDLAGIERSASSAAVAAGAFGYTAYVGADRVEGAVAVIELVP